MGNINPNMEITKARFKNGLLQVLLSEDKTYIPDKLCPDSTWINIYDHPKTACLMMRMILETKMSVVGSTKNMLRKVLSI
jgi:hypothetical protein